MRADRVFVRGCSLYDTSCIIAVSEIIHFAPSLQSRAVMMGV